MHRHDGFRTRRDRRLDQWRNDDAVRIAIDQHRRGPNREDGAHRGDEGVGLRDDLIAGTNSGGAQRQLQRREPGVGANRVGDATVIGELALEGRDVRAEDEVAPLQDRIDRVADRRL
jgi:hypothetical protein